MIETLQQNMHNSINNSKDTLTHNNINKKMDFLTTLKKNFIMNQNK